MRGSAVWRRGAGRWLFLSALYFVLVAPAGAGTPRTITDIRVWNQSIVIEAAEAGKVDLQAFTLDHPARVVFDLPDAVLAPGVSGSQSIDALGLGQVRIGRRAGGGVRLVVDLAEGTAPPGWTIKRGKHSEETQIVFGAAQPVRVGSPTVEKQTGRWVVRLPGAARAFRHVDKLANPPRVCVDVSDAVLAASFRQSFTGGPVREVRMAAHGSEHSPVVRLVVQLTEPQSYTAQIEGNDLALSFGERPESGEAQAPRVETRKSKAAASGAESVRPIEGLPPRTKEAQSARRTTERGLKGKVIVVDPGHGGAKPGAVYGSGKDEVMEKDITLDIGLRLARLLEAAGASVAMTRKDDSDVGLKPRADLANRLKADAFISIHVNSCATPDTLHGTSVYYDHENSVRLARVVQEALIGALPTRDNGIRSANFSVIRRAQCPGILIETAFINDAGDRRLLTDPAFREKTAQAILKGVSRFFSAAAAGSSPE